MGECPFFFSLERRSCRDETQHVIVGCVRCSRVVGWFFGWREKKGFSFLCAVAVCCVGSDVIGQERMGKRGDFEGEMRDVHQLVRWDRSKNDEITMDGGKTILFGVRMV